jgi:hypothetical protein
MIGPMNVVSIARIAHAKRLHRGNHLFAQRVVDHSSQRSRCTLMQLCPDW